MWRHVAPDGGSVSLEIPAGPFTPDPQTVSLPYSLPQSSFLSRFHTEHCVCATITLYVEHCSSLINELVSLLPLLATFPSLSP